MQIDLNEVAPLLKWNLEITIDGQAHRIRPWTLRDTQMLAQMDQLPAKEIYDWMLTLFEGDTAPDVRSWDEDRAAFFLGAVLGYKGSLTQKKTREVMERTKRLANAR
jgi:hypothetical protein